MKTGSLCTGYSGLELGAAAYFDIDLQWVADNDSDAAVALAEHHPGVLNLGDIKEVDWSRVTPVELLLLGFPCFVAGTRILTERGLVPIEDVLVGDLVLTHAGRWKPVTSTMSRVSDHIVKLYGQGLPHISTTEEHPFYARARRSEWAGKTRRRVFAAPAWIDAGKMADQFASQVLPPEEDSDGSFDLWWLVGRYLADGWTTSGARRNGKRRPNRVVICCAYAEADGLAERLGRVVHATRTEDITCTKFVITRAWFVDFVDRLGRGAAGKTLTRRELALPPDKAEALLDGWLTGDGCRTQGQWKGTTVSRSLALSMALLAQRARGVVASLHETAMAPSNVIAGRVVGQRTQYQVVIPDRNRSAFVEGAYGWKLVRRAVRVDAPVLVYNLSVADDESYVADGAVVHNCQDVSSAGRRAGLQPGNRSGIWSHCAYAIGVLRPQLVIIENVKGLLSARAHSDVEPCPWCMGNTTDKCLRALGAVLGDLASLGYDAEWETLPASDAGCCHGRERVFIVAWPAAVQDPDIAAGDQRRESAPV
jgi:hypothetical protein